MKAYEIRFCYKDPQGRFLNKLGRELSGADMPTSKLIAKGEAYDEATAKDECQYIIGAELFKEELLTTDKKSVYFRKMGDSCFYATIKDK